MLNNNALEKASQLYANKQNSIFFHKEPAGSLTPISLFSKLRKLSPYNFLLESVEKGKNKGRYSVIGLRPEKIWEFANEKITISDHDSSIETSVNDGKKIFAALQSEIDESEIAGYEDLPPMSSGLFGYMGYDMVQYMEKIPAHKNDELNIPDAKFIRPEIIVIHDNKTNEIIISLPIYFDAKIDFDALRAKKEKLLAEVMSSIKSEGGAKDISEKPNKLNFTSNFSKDEYCSLVKRSIEYIKAGDVFQVLPSRRFTADFAYDGFSFYKTLCEVNPSPFLFYMNFADFEIIGSSPEIMVKVTDETVTIRPLAGTRKRGKDETEDKKIAAELLADKKELAEHLMLLDLGRNDVGRITDDVKVTDKMSIEYFSHVMHISSNVEGKIKKNATYLDALIAGFPAGTVAGAPKIRAMQIIAEFEKDKRSFYSGCLGYFSGNRKYMDMAIMLRTALLKDKKLYIQSGAGVVYDSVAESEYEETESKAKALMHAAELVAGT